MTARIHIVVEEEEKERYRRSAEREGRTLSEWLREAARERLRVREQDRHLDSLDALRDFFAECDRREREPEPDWDEQRRRIERSARSGAADA